MDIPILLVLFLKGVFPNWGTWAPGLALAWALALALDPALALGALGGALGGPGGALGGPGEPWALALGPGPVAYTSNSR